jgi:hypothetical protein
MRTENMNKERQLSRQASGAILKDRLCVDVAGGKVAQNAVAGARCQSVARYAADDGRAASQQYGPSDVIVEAGAAIADNVEFMSDATGRAVLAAGAGNWVLGRVTNGSSASAAGQKITGEFYGDQGRQLP